MMIVFWGVFFVLLTCVVPPLSLAAQSHGPSRDAAVVSKSVASLVQLEEFREIAAQIERLEADLRDARREEHETHQLSFRLQRELRDALGEHSKTRPSVVRRGKSIVPNITARFCSAQESTHKHARKRSATAFHDAGTGSNNCPVGFDIIAELKRCRLAGAVLFPFHVDKVLTPINSSSQPKGCFFDAKSKQLSFNVNVTGGGANAAAHLLCLPRYKRGKYNLNACPEGYEHFAAMGECLAAGAALYGGDIASFGAVVEPRMASGCVYNRSARQLFLNAHTGKSRSSRSDPSNDGMDILCMAVPRKKEVFFSA
eukprot:TRINITY_DN22915_c0_g2_i3.p1 TRINITY_DN22915_c0_g2~~TRINITY_DN22915_c0_g2_i3.p1  ORF type:complete len:313 (-),score=37.46 TRINITY_DN22915_c0_g2_i3:31-969(-)